MTAAFNIHINEEPLVQIPIMHRHLSFRFVIANSADRYWHLESVFQNLLYNLMSPAARRNWTHKGPICAGLQVRAPRELIIKAL